MPNLRLGLSKKFLKRHSVEEKVKTKLYFRVLFTSNSGR